MSIDIENPLNDSTDNENLDLSLGERNEIQNSSVVNDSKFNNTTLFQAICTPYYFKQNEWIKMPKSNICIHQNSDGRNFITLNASATGRTLLNEYICPDSVIKQSSKNENVIQIKTKSRGLFSIRFGKNDLDSYNTLLKFSKDLINDSICWNYEMKEGLFLIERSPSLDITYDFIIKNNIDNSSDAFKLYCEKTTKYEIINQLYIKEGNNWVSLGLSKIDFVIPTYIMENDLDISESLEEMDLLNRNFIEPIITAHSIINMKKSGSDSLMCFLRSPINQDCIILKNRNIHDDNVYELNIMYEEKIFEYMIYSKKEDKSLAFISEFINKLSNFYSKVLEDKNDSINDPDLMIDKADNNTNIEIDDNKEETKEGDSIDDNKEETREVDSIDDNDTNKKEILNNTDHNEIEKEKVINESNNKKKIVNDDEDEDDINIDNNNNIEHNNNDNNTNTETNLLAGFTFMSTNHKSPQNQQKSEIEAPIENKFVFNMNDFTTNNSVKDKEKNKNTTSVFSKFTLSTNTASNTIEKTEEHNNDLSFNPLFASKPKFTVPSLNTNSFGFSFNTNKTSAKASSDRESDQNNINPLLCNSSTKIGLFGSVPAHNDSNENTFSAFGFSFDKNKTSEKSSNNDKSNQNNTNPLFGNSSTKTGLFGNSPLQFGISNNIAFNFTSSNKTNNVSDANTTPVTNTISEATKTSVILNSEENKKCKPKEVPNVQEEIETKQKIIQENQDETNIENKSEEKSIKVDDETKIAEIGNNDASEKIKSDTIQQNTTEINPVAALKNENCEKEQSEQFFSKDNKDISSVNLDSRDSEVDTSISCTLYDISEPYNLLKNESGKDHKIKDYNMNYFDLDTMKNGRLLALRFNQYIKSCDDLYIRAQNIAISNRNISLNYKNNMKDIKDSVYDIKKETKLSSIINESDTSILTYNVENSYLLNHNDTSIPKYNAIKKIRSISEMEIKSIQKENDIKGYNKLINKNKSLIKPLTNNYKNSLYIPNENLNEIKNLKDDQDVNIENKIIKGEITKNDLEETNVKNKIIQGNIKENEKEIIIENEVITKDKANVKDINKNKYKKESNIKTETDNKKMDEKSNKTGIVANLVSNINNNSINNQINTKKEEKEENCNNQHHVDKMAKEYMGKNNFFFLTFFFILINKKKMK